MTGRPPVPLMNRLLAKRQVGEDGCWLYTGSGNRGYGVIWSGPPTNKQIYVHRASFELFVGPVPDGLTLDHLCRKRNCFRPACLEPVSIRTNILRGEAPSALNARKERCPQGHQYDHHNGYQRVCRACRRETYSRYRIRQRELISA